MATFLRNPYEFCRLVTAFVRMGAAEQLVTTQFLRRTHVNYAGTINVFDAQILLFPVRSMYGPVWVTTADLLEEVEEIEIMSLSGDPPHTTNCLWQNKQINIGQQMIQILNPIEIGGTRWAEIPPRVQNRVIVVQEDNFGMIVNSNMEIRTSVAINHERGTAEPQALFTYEAIPRLTIFVMEVIEDNYRSDKDQYFPANKQGGWSWQNPTEVFKEGLQEIERRGIGGMGTRGFGRLRLLEQTQPTSAGGGTPDES